VRLTVHDGFDGRPRWSPDGKWIAFVTNRTGNQDIFIIPADGGSPRQVTFYGRGNIVADWSPDGQKLLFFSPRDTDSFLYEAFTTPNAQTNLFTVDLHSLAVKRLTSDSAPITDGAFSPNGKLLAYRRSGQPTWRPWYRGSEAAGVVVKDLTTNAVKTVLTSNAQQFFPLFSGDGKSLFITTIIGNSNTPNLWRLSLAGGEPKQVTKYTTDAVRSPQIARNGSLLTYLYNGDIYTIRPDGSDAKRVNILVRTDDKVNARQRQVLTGGAETLLSPDGKQIALVLKGGLWVMPSGGGDAKRLTIQDGNYADIAWSPDSSHIVVISDRGGQTDVYTLDVASKTLTRISNDDAVESDTHWSPDGKYVSYSKAGPNAGLYIAPAAGGAERRVAESAGNNEFGRGIISHSWAPDSRWIAFGRSDKIGTIDIWVVPTVGGSPINVTRYPGINNEPKFTRDGRKLVFVSTRGNAEQIYQLPLEKPGAVQTQKGPTADRSRDVRIDFDDIHLRAQLLPNFSGVDSFEPTPDSQRLVVQLQNHIFLLVGLNGGQVQQISIAPETAGTSQVAFTPDASRFYFTGIDGAPHSFPLGPFPPQMSAATAFSADYIADRQVLIQQAFEEFWRSYGAGFYDRTMHGVDWKALRSKYEALLPGISTPEEFTALLSNMVGEVNSSHSEISGASSVPPGPPQPTLAMIYDNDYTGPGLKVSAVMPGSPADTAGSKIQVGEYILSIDGEDVKNDENYYRAIQNKLGKSVDLLVNSSPSRDGARTVQLKPISAAQYDELDYDAKVKHTRDQVSKLSSGRLAYIHIKEMLPASLVKFNRELWSDAYLKEGLVLDIRGNGGGNTHDAILQALSHKVYGYIRARDGAAETQPVKAWDKPIVLLINESSFSDAEVFPQGFRALHLGKIVGVPTPGYVIGTIDASLLDGTHYRIPSIAYYTLDGRNMENLGIPPDIYVKNTPEDIAQHRDRQLETAVEVLLKANPDGVAPEATPTFQNANDNPDGGSSAVHYRTGK
jgi:Tol biopolymer transport system component/C-terminal processing protease CtpA/Prc